MSSTALVRMAWRNVWKNKAHSLSVLLSTATGFAAVCLFFGYTQRVDEQTWDGYALRGMLGDGLLQKKGAEDLRTEDSWAAALDKKEQEFLDGFLKARTDVDVRVRFLYLTGLIHNGKNSAIFVGGGHDLEDGARMRTESWAYNLVYGTPLYKAPKGSVILGVGLAEKMGCAISGRKGIIMGRPGPDFEAKCPKSRLQLVTTTEAAQVNAQEEAVSGFADFAFKEADDRGLSMSIEDAQRLADTDKVSFYSVRLKKNAATLEAFSQQLSQQAKEKGLDLEFRPWQKSRIAELYEKGSALLGVFRNFVMVIVVTISFLAMTSTLNKSVSERTQETGTLRALGFTPNEIQILFAWEGAFLSLLGVIPGAVLAFLSSWFIGRSGLSYSAGLSSSRIPLEISIQPMVCFGMGIFLLAIGALTAWRASKKATEKSVAEALRFH